MTVTFGTHVYNIGWPAMRAGRVIEAWEACSLALIWFYRHQKKKVRLAEPPWPKMKGVDARDAHTQ